ncbi:NAD(P)-dependent dehydrogenase (short-subunit alcohol dehydrogenase family) [Rhizobium sp. ERR 922]|uniref:SDR family oxidoreductase n=1 Tax=unclassified Rhizobium TaxID=2613769 RepID=UPI00119E795A|nr:MULTISPECIES: SDR family oxidoreductase [unclassified Rhizobium]TWB44039.1 NAD(P)-dependent dehydrogenase (short-subunit alcohol dehydrogenase family) [Rhizobium sp. ERR 922]TWB87650.1 NAD(P)-dependent dehydrogenase (short-subunit alcohol dehydrogenase family) [Rhizobium sp. ERR 942]
MERPQSITSRPVALVTGGAVRIGRAITERLAADGYAVAIHVRRRNEAACALAGRINEEGGRAELVEGDLADHSIVETLLTQASEKLGAVTLLVNNASKFDADEAISLDQALWDEHFAINLRAPAFLMRDLARQLPPGGVGAVVNVIDQRVWKLTPQFASYTLAKAALWTATKTFAQALAPRIRVNAVGPGPTLSNVRQSDDDFARQSGAVPLGRGSSPDQVAETVAYLARAESITGQMIAVDGGQHLAWQTPDVIGISE